MSSPCCSPALISAGWDWIPTKPPMGDDCCQGDDYIDQDYVADWSFDARGAFAGENALHSAVLMQLFTDKRLPKDQSVSHTDPFERGGWWGDYFAPFEMGSHLWTLYRSTLNENTIRLARRYVREALQPIIDQGAAVRQDSVIELHKSRQHLLIIPMLYAQDGSEIYKQQFSRVW